ncbi:MAG: tryptophan--tRNA ligase [Syntrophobacteraceae bacterium]|nr:tryptophan--tRNA ligase [Syntrophobacteraceae bacterium]
MERAKRILTGDRPTGRLHLGHWVGSLSARVRLQYEYDTILIVADLHMLTTKRSRGDIGNLLPNVRGLVLDYLASGMEPERSCIYLQSAVAETHELHTYLENFAKVDRLLRLPSLKQMARDAKASEQSLPFGLLGYPVLQAADILLARANLAPVGRDNLAHIEISRELARQFNATYGRVFPEPEPLLTDIPALVGTDNRGKMSKSAGNAIFLSDDEQTVVAKVRGMFTDPKRIRADIPGSVEGNPVFVYHRIFNENRAEVEELEKRYRTGKVGDTEVKEKLARALNLFLRPFRERFAFYGDKPRLIDQILLNGTTRVRRIAAETMGEVRERMGIKRVWKTLKIE